MGDTYRYLERLRNDAWSVGVAHTSAGRRKAAERLKRSMNIAMDKGWSRSRVKREVIGVLDKFPKPSPGATGEYGYRQRLSTGKVIATIAPYTTRDVETGEISRPTLRAILIAAARKKGQRKR